MSWSWTLYRYLAIQFLIGVAIVAGIILALVFSIDVVDLMNRTGGRATTGVVVGMALLQLPNLVQKVMPFAVLFGGVFAFARLSRSQELVATRAAGVSAWDFLMPPLVVAVGLGVLAVIAFTPFSARLLQEFSALEARYVKGQASQLAISENGLWLRQGDENNQAVIHATNVTDQGEHLYEVLVLQYGANDKFLGRIEAREGLLKPGHWELQDAWVSDGKGAKPEHHDVYNLTTELTPEQIEQNFTAPDALSFWDLPGYIRNAQAVGYSAARYELYFYTLLALPALFASMVFMAASFSLQLSRSRVGGLGKVVLISALAGFGVYFFDRLTTTLGQNGILPVSLAATAPAVTAILLGMTLVFHQEDG
jgi:lipopolysaccharide export system permease protein